MNPGKEAAVRDTIRAGLLKLASNAVLTREEIFGKDPAHSSDEHRAMKILRELATRGLIQTIAGKQNEPKLHSAKDAETLARIANDEVELTRLIWPGRVASSEPSWSIGDATSPLPIMHASETTPSLQEQIAGILKLLAALTENVIYVREKVDALSAVACAHCDNPEAHR